MSFNEIFPGFHTVGSISEKRVRALLALSSTFDADLRYRTEDGVSLQNTQSFGVVHIFVFYLPMRNDYESREGRC